MVSFVIVLYLPNLLFGSGPGSLMWRCHDAPLGPTFDHLLVQHRR
jgi:hypothetical protein